MCCPDGQYDIQPSVMLHSFTGISSRCRICQRRGGDL